MSNWTPLSLRTRLYAGSAAVLWPVAMATGLLTDVNNDLMDFTFDLFLFALLVLSIGVTAWSAMHCGNRLLRAGWWLVAVGMAAATAFAALMVSWGFGPAPSSFDGLSPGMTLSYFLMATGLAVAAASIRSEGDRRVPFFSALAASVFVFGLMATAMIAPGPSMPFDVGPRDVGALVRLAIDCGLGLGATAYAALLQLRHENAQRTRAWLWAAAAVIVVAMGDTCAPLLDLGHGQVYPAILWGMGAAMLAGTASFMADFARAEDASEPQR